MSTRIWLYKQGYGYTNKDMVIQTRMWLNKQVYVYTNNDMVIQTSIWLCKQGYGHTNKGMVLHLDRLYRVVFSILTFPPVVAKLTFHPAVGGPYLPAGTKPPAGGDIHPPADMAAINFLPVFCHLPSCR